MAQFLVSFISLLSLLMMQNVQNPTEKELIIGWSNKANEYREHLIRKNPEDTLELKVYNNEKLSHWVKKVTEYRNHLIRKNPEGTLELKQLLTKWDSLRISNEEQSSLIMEILVGTEIFDYSFKDVKKNMKNYHAKAGIVGHITEEDIYIIRKNGELLNLVRLGVLKPTYPFTIDLKCGVFVELLFYNIDSTHVVGEVGAGTGAFSMLVNLIVPNAKININELEQSHLTYINKIVMASSNLFKIENFELVKGDEKSTNFNENQMDKIIIRNSFHHFGKKEKMLCSIRNSLKGNGELFILDPVKEQDSDGSMCKLALKKQEIIDLVTKNGFKLEDQMPGIKMTFFRFVKV